MDYDFDLFVIGGGSGGISSARRAAQYGAKVGIAESWTLGGTCVNRGCVPKKLMMYASRFPEQFEVSTGYGWSAPKSEFDWKHLITAVNQELGRLNGIYESMLDRAAVQVFPHHASFLNAHTLDVGGQKVTADKILIAVGGKPVRPPIPGIEHAITSDDIFHLEEQPRHAVILGGGYIGCEFACILNGLGTKVTQVIRGDKILRGFDDDIRSEIQAKMIADGIDILSETNIKEITKTDSGIIDVCLIADGEEDHILADVVSLAALGRKPNIDNLGLENTQVELAAGAIAVDKYNTTAASNIFAVGDVTDKINLTPVAISEGRAFADTQFGGQSRIVSYENIPTAVFTSPEAATVGLTEAEAIEQYGEDGIKIYRSRFRPMFYTMPDIQKKTLMKLIVHQDSDRVLGAHMVGDDAAEIVQGVAIALKTGATKANFDATVGIHPSAAEEFVTMR
ncbi:glutathione-disulfide reductase [Oscillatoria sp. CS-180]|uniref:glutathione-disulfide reductase n=1 Tax=Oscillatoria sp. CS-180 TaxID=3021720 RepID=UPI00232D0428|nr:glutathione-disulfide reductase [Oscillatoria sp. CS-180]MDB9528123.1 glutathione-disulfide reductase [Oscillatoria sp. CS-180]